MGVGYRQMRDLLQARCDELVGRLFLGARLTYPVFQPLNPTRNDKSPGSFVIWMRGAGAGGFNEYSPAGPPASGDIIDLIAYVHNYDHKSKEGRIFAMRWAEDFLGLKSMSADDRRRMVKRAQAQASEQRQAESAKRAARRARAQEMWLKADDTIAGTLAEIYLANRRIPFAAICNPETDLRFKASLEWWKGAEWKVECGKRIKVKEGPKFPAMIAAMRNKAGDITAVHCTFLRNDGSAKADVDGAKLMFGDVRGAVIRLTRGPSNMTWEEAAGCGLVDPLGVSEGIESGLSVALAVPELRVCAAGSIDNIGNVPLDHACIDYCLIAKDNDPGHQAQAALERAVDALRAHGKRVEVMAPHETDDFNSLLQTT